LYLIFNKDLKKYKLNKVSQVAWETRSNSNANTKVGAVVKTNNILFSGCNVEHQFRSHDIHAEISAISSLVSDGFQTCDLVFIVAEREKFTPCGSCMDWIFEIGGEKCAIMFQNNINGDVQVYTAKELMPFYPK